MTDKATAEKRMFENVFCYIFLLPHSSTSARYLHWQMLISSSFGQRKLLCMYFAPSASSRNSCYHFPKLLRWCSEYVFDLLPKTAHLIFFRPEERKSSRPSSYHTNSLCKRMLKKQRSFFLNMMWVSLRSLALKFRWSLVVKYTLL